MNFKKIKKWLVYLFILIIISWGSLILWSNYQEKNNLYITCSNQLQYTPLAKAPTYYVNEYFHHKEGVYMWAYTKGKPDETSIWYKTKEDFINKCVSRESTYNCHNYQPYLCGNDGVYKKDCFICWTN